MKTVVLDITKNEVVSGASGADNYYSKVAVRHREEIIDTLIERIPTILPCTFFSRSQPETVSYSTSIYKFSIR